MIIKTCRAYVVVYSMILVNCHSIVVLLTNNWCLHILSVNFPSYYLDFSYVLNLQGNMGMLIISYSTELE
jgi:hypothetical protein